MCKLYVLNDCDDVVGPTTSSDTGLYWITINNYTYPVHCYFDGAGKRFTVFQKRLDGSVSFYETWDAYENGFGNLKGEFWLGNRLINQITTRTIYDRSANLNKKLFYTMTVIGEAFNGQRAYSHHTQFNIGPKGSKYPIWYNTCNGNYTACICGKNLRFSTWDRDNDNCNPGNCVVLHKGAWWHDCCFSADLNGLYYEGGSHADFATGANWNDFRGFYESLKKTWMMLMREG